MIALSFIILKEKRKKIPFSSLYYIFLLTTIQKKSNKEVLDTVSVFRAKLEKKGKFYDKKT